MAPEEPMARLGAQFTQLSAALTAPDGSGLDPDRVVRYAARSLPDTSHCGLTLLRPDRPPRTLSATDELALAVDRIQYELREGPCLDASEGDVVELSGELDHDRRWPHFGPRCAEQTGVVSMLSVRLRVVGGDHAAMNFYSPARDAFTDLDVGLASIFAPFAALAVEHTLREQDAQNLHHALQSSRQIGTAIGILMARNLVTSDEAFEMLRTASQHLNRKLRDLAYEVTETGELPVEGEESGQARTRDGSWAAGRAQGE